MISNSDFAAFQKEVTWFLKPNSTIRFIEGQVRLSVEFEVTFPKLATLIKRARVTFFEVNGTPYQLFTWDSAENLICGWLNSIQDLESSGYQIIEEHELLIRNIGGIMETFNGPEDSLSGNQNFMFLGSACTRSIGDWDDYYTMACEDENCNKIDTSPLLAFAEEANGALTMYNLITKKVMLFSHDHSFEHVDFMDQQPEYTFHTFRGIDSFSAYVEALAGQWLAIIAD